MGKANSKTGTFSAGRLRIVGIPVRVKIIPKPVDPAQIIIYRMLGYQLG